MAFSLARVAGAGLRRRVKPVVGSASNAIIFGKTCCRPSIRLSDAPFKKTEDHFDGWTAEELTWARSIIDAKLKDKGLALLRTGNDARTESMIRTVTKELAQLKVEVAEIKNKKGDIAAVPIGNSRTINLMSVLTLWMKAEELWPMLPSIEAWIKSVL